jgi:hypothetical protein
MKLLELGKEFLGWPIDVPLYCYSLSNLRVNPPIQMLDWQGCVFNSVRPTDYLKEMLSEIDTP